jgi:hypothetical protein
MSFSVPTSFSNYTLILDSPDKQKLHNILTITRLYRQVSAYRRALADAEQHLAEEQQFIEQLYTKKDDYWSTQIQRDLKSELDMRDINRLSHFSNECDKILTRGPRKGQPCNDSNAAIGGRCIKHPLTEDERQLIQQKQYDEEQEWRKQCTAKIQAKINKMKEEHCQDIEGRKSKAAARSAETRHKLTTELAAVTMVLQEMENAFQVTEPSLYGALLAILEQERQLSNQAHQNKRQKFTKPKTYTARDFSPPSRSQRLLTSYVASKNVE